jgi:hypothetical protein
MSSNPIERRLQPVQVRQTLGTTLRDATRGLLVGAVAGAVYAAVRFVVEGAIPVWVGPALIAAGPAVGAMIGWLRRGSIVNAATAVDQHYGLKDRALSALSFSRRPERTPAQELAVVDADEHLSVVNPREVAPLNPSRSLPYAAIAAGIAAVALVVTWHSSPVEAVVAAPDARIIDAALTIEESLKELEEEVRKEPNPELEALLKEMQEKLAEMKSPGVDERTALARMSEMQASLQAMQQQYNPAAIDAELKALGEAMTLSKEMSAAGKALASGEHNKASEELEKLQMPEMDRKTARTMEESLKKASEKLGQLGQKSMQDATGEMCEACKSGDGKGFKEGSQKLSSSLKKHSRRKSINDLLRKQSNCIGECKSDCIGNCDSNSNGSNKSKGPKAGKGTAGKPGGEKTALAGNKRQVQVSGKVGDSGETEVETENTNEAQQEATRDFVEKYARFRKESEAVLDSEPIPFGHRQTIRRYFELIRPDNETMDAVRRAMEQVANGGEALPASETAPDGNAAAPARGE